jgi:hypothetical protein
MSSTSLNISTSFTCERPYNKKEVCSARTGCTICTICKVYPIDSTYESSNCDLCFNIVQNGDANNEVHTMLSKFLTDIIVLPESARTKLINLDKKYRCDLHGHDPIIISNSSSSSTRVYCEKCEHWWTKQKGIYCSYRKM